MRARDIQIELPMIDRTRSAAEASRVIADTGRIGVVVADRDGNPLGMITAIDLFRLALPEYLLSDPSLAATLDEEGIAELIAKLRDKSVGEVIDDDSVRLRPVPEVDPGDTVVEIAAVMASAGSTIAVVTGTQGRDVRFVTLPVALDAVLNYAAGADPTESGGHGA
jgi:CBS domain-containing protein